MYVAGHSCIPAEAPCRPLWSPPPPRRQQLKALVGLHGEMWADGAEVPLTMDEVQVNDISIRALASCLIGAILVWRCCWQRHTT